MKLIFAVDHTTRGGRSYKAGSTHEVNDHDARSLLLEGLAQVDTTAKADTNKKEAPRG